MLYVSRLTPSAFDEGTVYATFDGHRSDNFEPYVRVSTDYGQSWNSITSNLPRGSVYTIKEDTQKANVLSSEPSSASLCRSTEGASGLAGPVSRQWRSTSW